MNGSAAQPWWSGLVALAVVVVVGWVDHLTGPEVGFSLFYLLPIAWSGWRLGRAWVAATVLTAAGSWLFAELAWYGSAPGSILWNGFTRLVIYAVVGGMLVVVREDRVQLEALNRRLQESLEAQTRLARTDLLTGLPNGRWFTEELRRRIATKGEEGKPVCLLYVDIDNFKALNDHYGHSAGDGALREIGDALRASIRSGAAGREEDLAARLGGDEFAILLGGAGPDEAAAIAGRIIDRITAVGATYPDADLGASVGIALSLGIAESPEDLIRRADRAMYQSKEGGKGRVTVGA